MECIIRGMTKGEWGKTKAYFDVEIGGVTIKGCRLVEGENGLFASMPSIRKDGEDGNPIYQTMVFLSDELKVSVLNSAKERYEEKAEVKMHDTEAEAVKDLPFYLL